MKYEENEIKIGFWKNSFEGTVMQIEKAPISYGLSVSKVSWKLRIPAIYNFAVIYP